MTKTMKDALHRISLASQNSMSSKEECGRIAREALDAATAEEAALDNYSKPFGWSCSRTGVTWSSPRHHTEECWGDLPCLSPLVPVYLPLLVPEKTTWGASGGDGAVCCEYLECIGGHGGGGVLDYSLGSDVWRERAVSVYDDGEILIHEPPDVRGLSFAYQPCADVASAIRFVAGRRRRRRRRPPLVI